ncbi:hypothetical protein M011DRAFT_186297 [Sporormia fimetaria CBS 119925]|uniref:Uncharacterized protein n=1 Tax=Sporormia fimetaria CBS 119925 TaxID=1340428 RepID=A0A6A6VL54_9PLEO|nr:hypothetical protein M011DRAFT_186297 [Sporormia fimetaria CBS 119925]
MHVECVLEDAERHAHAYAGLPYHPQSPAGNRAKKKKAPGNAFVASLDDVGVPKITITDQRDRRRTPQTRPVVCLLCHVEIDSTIPSAETAAISDEEQETDREDMDDTPRAQRSSRRGRAALQGDRSHGGLRDGAINPLSEETEVHEEVGTSERNVITARVEKNTCSRILP